MPKRPTNTLSTPALSNPCVKTTPRTLVKLLANTKLRCFQPLRPQTMAKPLLEGLHFTIRNFSKGSTRAVHHLRKPFWFLWQDLVELAWVRCVFQMKVAHKGHCEALIKCHVDIWVASHHMGFSIRRRRRRRSCEAPPFEDLLLTLLMAADWLGRQMGGS